MKLRKKSLVAVLTLVLGLGLAASAWAGPWGGGWGRGWGCGMMNLTPDQSGKLFDLKQKFFNDTAKLRKQMLVTRAELAKLWQANKPDEKAIVAKGKELNTLRGEMQAKGVAFMLAARQICPQYGQGYGPGWGHHMGRGWHGPMWGRGMGPGGYNCPYGYGGAAAGGTAPATPAQK
jgi:Spy/CpxP family protein refolding chaperone